MVRIPNPLDALGALAAIPASLGITALLKLTDPGASTLYGLAERGSGVRACADWWRGEKSPELRAWPHRCLAALRLQAACPRPTPGRGQPSGTPSLVPDEFFVHSAAAPLRQTRHQSAHALSVDGFDADGLRTLAAIALAHGDAVDPAAPLLVVATDLFPERHPDAEQELRRVAATLAHRDRVLAAGRIWELDEAPAEIPPRAEWARAEVKIALGETDRRTETALILRSSQPAIASAATEGEAPAGGEEPAGAADRTDPAVGTAQPRTASPTLTGHWAVSTVTTKARVTVSGRGPCPDRVVLAAVTDLGPYVSGARSRAFRLAKRTFS